ncbi:hypothetical protein BT63DRAFT_102838 [Microthyrium microscopicum]|uniref:Uncharacterized protein n=1 Tax=Microthyrium microscopicum TaxID=703497 RepID=A0A6A6TXK3_9PEZI|nr:hypothetical protein BT63DRAFT_102838 [Microthyrium microscopicum]
MRLSHNDLSRSHVNSACVLSFSNPFSLKKVFMAQGKISALLESRNVAHFGAATARATSSIQVLRAKRYRFTYCSMACEEIPIRMNMSCARRFATQLKHPNNSKQRVHLSNNVAPNSYGYNLKSCGQKPIILSISPSRVPTTHTLSCQQRSPPQLA